MLVRLDPDKEATAIMSLPRDLKVEIPGHGTDKINAAYELGGPELTLETVKAVTGLPINHVINVHFGGFWRAVNAVGCVYVDIDRRYFNDSAEYSYIDVQPGYQRMCGREALQYVRFRHEDTDIVRAARQQDFLRQAKQQIAASELIDKRDRLVKIFGRNTSTDTALRSRLRGAAAAQAGAVLGRPADPRGALPGHARAELRGVDRRADERDDRRVPQRRGHARPARPGRRQGQAAASARSCRAVGDIGLEDATGFGKDQAIQAVQAGAGDHAARPLPGAAPAVGSVYAGPPRVYKLRGTDGKRYGAYRMVLQTGVIGEYYGLQGTTWKNPPILEGVTETRKVGRRTYELV